MASLGLSTTSGLQQDEWGILSDETAYSLPTQVFTMQQQFSV